MITLENFIKIFPHARQPEVWIGYLTAKLELSTLTSNERLAMFLAQCGHESGGFTALEENLHYKASGLLKVFPKYFNEQTAEECANNPVKIANIVYANRMGNGDTESGDGYKFRGRGLIQLTGRTNYTKFSHAVKNDESILNDPNYLVTFVGAIESALWFWDLHHLADKSDGGDVLNVTKIINGGTNGIEDRTKLYGDILSIL